MIVLLFSIIFTHELLTMLIRSARVKRCKFNGRRTITDLQPGVSQYVLHLRKWKTKLFFPCLISLIFSLSFFRRIENFGVIREKSLRNVFRWKKMNILNQEWLKQYLFFIKSLLGQNKSFIDRRSDACIEWKIRTRKNSSNCNSFSQSKTCNQFQSIDYRSWAWIL